MLLLFNNLPVLPLDDINSFVNKNKKKRKLNKDSFQDVSESIACTSSAVNRQNTLTFKENVPSFNFFF